MLSSFGTFSRMAAPGPSGAPQNEFIIKVPKKDEYCRFSVLKFNETDNIDTARWTAENLVKMEREDNKQVVMSSQAVQEYGEGTEYGRAARDEARRKKYGRQARSYHLDNQPWHLSFTETGTDGRERKMNGIREGDGHSDFWVFLKKDNDFHAYKVDDMHRFMPAITHRTLDIDQAEEKFLLRNKVMNQFALKAQIMSQFKATDEEGEVEAKGKRSLKIKDDHSSDESEDDGGDEEGEDGGDNEKKKKKKTKKADPKKRKDKRQRVENGDEVAKYESSDGEDEGREYDYMSDSGSDSDREQVKVDEKMDKELVGVGDEDGLKKNSDSESDSDEEDFTKKLLHRDDEKKKDNLDIEERDSSGSDSDDPDKEKMDSVVFMQKKEATGEAANGAKKRPAIAEAAVAPGTPDAKKVKTDSIPEGLNEATVRKYLCRKPHTTKELLTKIKSKCGDMDKSEIVTKLAAILKSIEPHQFKQRQGKKEVLFFSLTNNLA